MYRQHGIYFQIISYSFTFSTCLFSNTTQATNVKLPSIPCAEIFASEARPIDLKDYVHSLLEILKYSQREGIFEPSAFDFLSTHPFERAKEWANQLQNRSDTIQSKTALIALFNLDGLKSYWPDIQRQISQLNDEQKTEKYARAQAQTKTEAVFSPEITHTEATDVHAHSATPWQLMPDGRVLMALSDRNSVTVLDLNNLKTRIRFSMAGIDDFDPQWFVTQDGRTLILMPSRSFGLWVMDVDKPNARPRKFNENGNDGEGSAIITKRGQDLIAVAESNRVRIYDERNSKKPVRDIKTKERIVMRTSLFLNSEGQPMITFLTRFDERNEKYNLHILNLDDETKEFSTPTSISWASPTVHHTHDGRVIIAHATQNGVEFYDLNDLNNPVKVAAPANASPNISLFSTNQRDFFAFQTRTNEIIFGDLKNPQTLKRLTFPERMHFGDSISWHQFNEDEIFLCFSIDRENYLVDFNSPDGPNVIETMPTSRHGLNSFTQSNGEKIITIHSFDGHLYLVKPKIISERK